MDGGKQLWLKATSTMVAVRIRTHILMTLAIRTQILCTNKPPWSSCLVSGVTMGTRGLKSVPPGIPIQNSEKIGPHLRLQDTKCSSIDMPLEKVVHPLVPPWKLDPSYATAFSASYLCTDGCFVRMWVRILTATKGRSTCVPAWARYSTVNASLWYMWA